MRTLHAVHLERANLGPIDRDGHKQAPPVDLARRLLEQIAAGAIWANLTNWARDADVRDTAGNYLDHTQRATANAALTMLRDWIGSHAIMFTGGADDDGMWLVKLRDPGHALLADLLGVPEDGPR